MWPINKIISATVLILAMIVACNCSKNHVTVDIWKSKSESSHTTTPLDAFTTVWKTDNAGTSSSNQISLPLDVTGTYNFIVDWGDSSTSTITAWNDSATTHSYAIAGTYTVKMTGTFDRFIFNSSGDAEKILDISKWSANKWSSMQYAFYGCTNMTVTASDIPDFSQATDLSLMFAQAPLVNSDMSSWDVSTITNMYAMFYGASAFNSNITGWDTSHVTNMAVMFHSASSFNQNIGSWDTSSVTDMRQMFGSSAIFNQDISGWDTSHVTDMQLMFGSAVSFNQNLSSWDVSAVTDHTSFAMGATAWVLPKPSTW